MENDKFRLIALTITILLFSIVLYLSILNKYAIKEIKQTQHKQHPVKIFNMQVKLDKNIIVDTKKNTPFGAFDPFVQQIKYLDLTYTERK